MEPSPKEKRRRFSRTLAGRDIEPDLEAIKSRLRELREYSLREHGSLLEEFKSNIAGYRGIRVVSAYDAEEAVDYIAKVALGTENIVVNRSSLVTNELRPGLERHGLKVIQPYYAEFDSFESKIRDYWDLPNLLRKGLTGAFSISSTGLGLGPGRGKAVKDCIAVLGVNAVSAKDCSIFFLQHFSNISKSLEQAREVVLIVGLDRLVKDREDAAFHTRCMGIFGMESMLLNLRPSEVEPGDMDSLPSFLGGEGGAVHIILLDNGRSRILGSGLEELLLCIGCRACIKQCPINRAMSEDGAVWSPKDYLSMFLLDEGRSLDTCLHCEACRVECPLAIDIPGLMWMAEADHIARHGRGWRNRVLGNPELLARAGSLAAPISNAVIGIEPSRTVVHRALGFDTSRRLPRFRHETLKRWFARRGGGNGGPGGSRRLAYYVGCFANYYEPEMARALIGVLERNGFEVLVPDQRCCGMPMMANKNMSGARRNAEYNIESLARAAANGYDIVTGCPSCSLMIKREYPNLYDSDKARLVSDHLYYVDEYLMLLSRRGDLNRDLVEISESIFYHVPCHLKVQDLAGVSLELLHLIPGLSIERVDAACCGMAGYHGYKKAHSDLSMEIGGKLFGEIGLAQADRVVTGCGACKLQIEAGSGARAIHPIVLLQEAYGLGPYLS
ncbi:MAG: anaerobic glycerol-3-phosphate dehydrogenase subunit C [Dehalococcoidia bacterium]